MTLIKKETLTMDMRNFPVLFILLCAFTLTGCGAAAVGGAAYGGYTTVKEERSIGTIIDDSWISTKVKTKMISDEFVKSRYIDVDVLNGVVFLVGVVESESQKRMAGDIARGVEGVRHVENQLMVGKTSAGQILDDTVLSSKIKTELIKSPNVQSTNIDVDTTNNVVTLTGIVESVKEKDTALYIAHKVAGNRRIVDNLTVKN